MILYVSTDLREFEQKLNVYRTIRTRSTTKYEDQKSNSNLQANHSEDKLKNSNKNYEKQYCFNCAEVGHKSNNCKHKNKGYKCLKCSNFGHRSKY